MSVLIAECTSIKGLAPLTDIRFSWNLSSGCFTNLERLKRHYPRVLVISYRQKEISSLLEEEKIKSYNQGQPVELIINSQYIPEQKIPPGENVLAVDKHNNLCYLQSSKITQGDILLFLKGDKTGLEKKYNTKVLEESIYLAELADIINYNTQILAFDTRTFITDSEFVSPAPGVYVHKKARVDQYVTLNADQGIIIIDKDSHIRPFTIIDGPAYVGKHSLLDSAKVRSGTTIRDYCRIGGEVESSIIESFSNKHHEGFLGHSYLGSWVNIGAMATTSDLKNNYGKIRIQVGDTIIDTDSIKLGSFIGDYAKIGIGLMINTGTVISPGANIFNSSEPYSKYIKPFQWGPDAVYRIDRFISDLKTIMARRQKNLGTTFQQFLEKYYRRVIKNKELDIL